MNRSDPDLDRAVACLRDGGLVAFSTETVYGLGADASSGAALRRLYAVKRRPASHPVIVHVAASAQLDEWAIDVSDTARVVAEACWPGPLTLVLRRRAHVLDEVTGGQDTVAVRVPSDPVALELLTRFDGGVAAPSANRHGRVSPTTAAAVRADLGTDVDVVLDGGPCRIGVESTVLDWSRGEPVILRPGGIGRERLEELLGHPVAVGAASSTADRPAVRAPGTLVSHYAPDARVELIDDPGTLRLRAERLLAEHRVVGVLAPKLPDGLPSAVRVLATPVDADEYARVLFSSLRDADAAGVDVVLAQPPPQLGVGVAVADRLARAAATRADDDGAAAPR